MRYFKIVILIGVLIVLSKVIAKNISDLPSEKSKDEINKVEYCSQEIGKVGEMKLTKICIPEPVKDFGEIDKEVLSHDFIITNSGEEPLIIRNVRGSGGNMPSSFPKDPIPVGGESIIKTKLHTKGKKGKLHKSWSIVSNTIPRISRVGIKAKLDYCTEDYLDLKKEGLTKICMPELKYNYGEVKSGILIHSFKIKNKGPNPLQIKYVKANAGDNIGSYPKGLIEVGEEIVLKAKWDATNQKGKRSRRWEMICNTYPERIIFTVDAIFPK